MDTTNPEAFMAILKKHFGEEKQITALEEIGAFNVKSEHDAIERFVRNRGGYKNKYEEGRHKTLRYILDAVENDPQNGDWGDDNHWTLMKEAGRLLYEDSGMHGMHAPLVWSFIPNRYHREIDMIWDSIGEWQS